MDKQKDQDTHKNEENKKGLKGLLFIIFSNDSVAEKIEERLSEFELDWFRLSNRLFWAFVSVLVAGFFIYIYAAVKTMPFPYEFKGWAGGFVMHNTWMLSHGRNYYVDPVKEASSASCYTPGLQILIAPFAHFFGPQMWVGRIVSTIGLIMIWIIIYQAVFRQTRRRIYGFISIGMLMVMFGAFQGHFDSIHPDSWTIAWGLITLFLAEISIRKRGFVILAALTGALSYFTKQPGLSFSMGAVLFLFLNKPSRAIVFIILIGCFLSAGHIAGEYLTDGMFWNYTINASSQQPIYGLLIPVRLLEIFMVASAGLVVFLYCALDRPSSLAITSPYALSLPIIFLLYGAGSIRRGGGGNNFFPVAVLGVILLAIGLQYIREHVSQKSARISCLLFLLLLCQSILFIVKLPPIPTKAHYKTAEKIEKIIKNTPGEVLVFNRISFAYLNGRPVYDNFMVMLDSINWTDHSRFEHQIETKYFERLLITKESVDLWMIAQPFYKNLTKNYVVEDVIVFPEWYQTTPMYIYRRK